MPKPLRLHWARLRATCHPTEDPERVVLAMATVAGVAADEFAGAVERSQVESHHGGSLLILEAKLDKSRAVRDLLERIVALPGGREKVVDRLEARVDDEGVLFVRVQKQAAALGSLHLTDGDDCVQLRFKVEAYPANRETVLEQLRTTLA